MDEFGSGPMAALIIVLWFALIGLGPLGVVLHLRRGLAWGLGVPIAAACMLLPVERVLAALGAGLDPGDLALPYLIGLGLLAPAIAEGLRLRWSATRVMLTAIGLSVGLRFAFATAVANVAALFNLNPAGWALIAAEGTDPFLGVSWGLGMMPGRAGGPLDQETVSMLARINGAGLMLNVILVAFVTMVISRRLLDREGSLISLERLDRWRAPESMIFMPIGSAALWLLGQDRLWRDIGVNLFLVSMAPFLFQGLSIISYWFGRLRVASWVRALLLAVLIIQPVTIAALAAAGVGDIWFDLRRLSRKPESDEGDEGREDDDDRSGEE